MRVLWNVEELCLGGSPGGGVTFSKASGTWMSGEKNKGSLSCRVPQFPRTSMCPILLGSTISVFALNKPLVKFMTPWVRFIVQTVLHSGLSRTGSSLSRLLVGSHTRIQ